MPLLSLPPELILSIVKQLHIPNVEVLAQTFNKRLYDACIPLLAKRIAARKHAKRMIARFGLPLFQSEMEDVSCEQAKLLGFPSEHDISIPNKPPNLDYLNLNGDLSWLEPLDEKTARAMERYHRGPADGGTDLLDKLVADAEKLGLVLPEGFIKFMSREELQYRIPSAQAAFFTLGEDGLRKCPAAVDGGAGGYLIRIMADQQWCWTWNLYLYPGEGKGHAVCGSAVDANANLDQIAEALSDCKETTRDEFDQAKNEGFPLAWTRHLALTSFSFEEFLATTYYEEQIWYVRYDDMELSQGLRKYIDNTYIK
ncbi:hypothetical protein FZEAL_5708 [Fusarium zealandicum]|uniref:Uncharacterized protein n=1 Tax=Fusarium zealandicum TaxID=1053134 RepID=A0A8H4UK70_9HYPO|nr:hypothetical protein FZEAL_5708 [Fusarium zealandicum]